MASDRSGPKLVKEFNDFYTEIQGPGKSMEHLMELFCTILALNQLEINNFTEEMMRCNKEKYDRKYGAITAKYDADMEAYNEAKNTAVAFVFDMFQIRVPQNLTLPTTVGKAKELLESLKTQAHSLEMLINAGCFAVDMPQRPDIPPPPTSVYNYVV